jgi:hypothetical protein
VPGAHKDVYAGVSYKSLAVVSRRSNELIIQIPLEILQYKVAVFSIYIDHHDETLRFDGRMLLDIDMLIKKYLTMRKLLPQLYDMISSSQVKMGMSARTTGVN